MTKRGQISIEYMMIFSFITFTVIGFLAVAYYYSYQTQDSIKFKHIDNFATKIISNAESVYYSGESSMLTVSAYLPVGVNNIEVYNNELVFEINTNSGLNIISFSSEVPLSGNISRDSGMKKIVLIATQSYVNISH
jgi:uncharacterized protein (UPF0333 family)